jgi:hypothetical protein
LWGTVVFRCIFYRNFQNWAVKLYHIMFGSLIYNFWVINIDYIGRYKSNYHITTTKLIRQPRNS